MEAWLHTHFSSSVRICFTSKPFSTPPQTCISSERAQCCNRRPDWYGWVSDVSLGLMLKDLWEKKRRRFHSTVYYLRTTSNLFNNENDCTHTLQCYFWSYQRHLGLKPTLQYKDCYDISSGTFLKSLVGDNGGWGASYSSKDWLQNFMTSNWRTPKGAWIALYFVWTYIYHSIQFSPTLGRW